MKQNITISFLINLKAIQHGSLEAIKSFFRIHLWKWPESNFDEKSQLKCVPVFFLSARSVFNPDLFRLYHFPKCQMMFGFLWLGAIHLTCRLSHKNKQSTWHLHIIVCVLWYGLDHGCSMSGLATSQCHTKIPNLRTLQRPEINASRHKLCLLCWGPPQRLSSTP